MCLGPYKHQRIKPRLATWKSISLMAEWRHLMSTIKLTRTTRTGSKSAVYTRTGGKQHLSAAEPERMCVTTSGRQMLSSELTPPRSMKPNEQPPSSRHIEIQLHLATVGVRFCTERHRHVQQHINVTHTHTHAHRRTCTQMYGTKKHVGLWLFSVYFWHSNWAASCCPVTMSNQHRPVNNFRCPVIEILCYWAT